MNFMRNLSIQVKLSIFSASLVIVSCAAIALSVYQFNANKMLESGLNRLMEVAKSRKAELASYLDSINTDLLTLSKNPATIQAVQDFDTAWEQLPAGSQTTILQAAYIADNPYPLGKKDELDRAGDSQYDIVHELYHPPMRFYLREKGYYDIFLFDLDGDLVYSVFKEIDYATNFLTGPLKDSDLGNAFKAALNSTRPESVHFFDFKPYSPSYGAPASFISTAIYDGEEKVGVLVMQMPIDRINAIMNRESLLGETGEVLIVGADNLLRNDSAFSAETDILATRITTDAIQQALDGNTVNGRSSDYRDILLEIYAVPLEFHGVTWAVSAVEAVDEILAPIVQMRNQVLEMGAIFTIIAIMAAVVFAYVMVRPLNHLTLMMGRLAQGDTDITLDARPRGDEIGKMQEATRVLRDAMIKRVQLEKNLEKISEQERDARQLSERKNLDIKTSIEAFNANIEKLLASVSDSMSAMQQTAHDLADSATDTDKNTSKATHKAEENADNVQSLAAASEELSNSIAEINNQVTKASSDLARATEDTNSASDKINALDQSAQNIGVVISTIQDIAEQTNLLALNATIEAARAGDAGKGFAVVASEVKTLAEQTARATQDIASQIEAMQQSTVAVVKVIENVSQTTREVNGYTTSIASAMQQQEASTNDISLSVQRTADNSKAVFSHMQESHNAVEKISQSAGNVDTTSRNVNEQIQLLSQEIDQFLKKMTATA